MPVKNSTYLTCLSHALWIFQPEVKLFQANQRTKKKKSYITVNSVSSRKKSKKTWNVFRKSAKCMQRWDASSRWRDYTCLIPFAAPHTFRGDDTYIKCQALNGQNEKGEATAKYVLLAGSAEMYERCAPEVWRPVRTLFTLCSLLLSFLLSPFFFQFQFQTGIWNKNLFPGCWSEGSFFFFSSWLSVSCSELASGVLVLKGLGFVKHLRAV